MLFRITFSGYNRAYECIDFTSPDVILSDSIIFWILLLIGLLVALIGSHKNLFSNLDLDYNDLLASASAKAPISISTESSSVSSSRPSNMLPNRRSSPSRSAVHCRRHNRWYISLNYLITTTLGIIASFFYILGTLFQKSVGPNELFIANIFLLVLTLHMVPYLAYWFSRFVLYLYLSFRRNIFHALLAITGVFILKFLILGPFFPDLLPDWGEWTVSSIFSVITWRILSKHTGGLI